MKRLMIALATLAPFWSMVAIGCLGASRAPIPGRVAPPSSRFDSVIFATAATAVARSREIDRVWPGFWDPPAFAIYRPDTAVFLYTTDPAPTGFTVVRHPQLPSVLRRRLYVHEGQWPGLRGGVLPIDTKAPRLAMAVNVSAGSPVSRLESLIHESFHGWQVRHFERFFDPDVPQMLPDTVTLPGDLDARLQAERHLLWLAVETGSLRERRAFVRDYLAARRARFTAGGRLAEQVEQAQERREGTADYVGVAGALAASGTSADVLQWAITLRLLSDARWGAATDAPKRRLLNRTYVTGSAMSFLLDQLRCGDWRARTTAGEFLDVLLADCIELSNVSHRPLMPRAS